MMIEETIDIVDDEYALILRTYAILSGAGMTMNPSLNQLPSLFVNDSEHRVAFTATYRELTFRFTRGETNNSNVKYYTVSVDNTNIDSKNINFNSTASTSTIDTEISRIWHFKIVTNEDVLFIKMWGTNSSSSTFYHLFLFDTTANNEDYVLYQNDSSNTGLLKSRTFYILSDETNTVYKSARLLQYTVPNNGVDTLNSLVFCGTATEENAVKSLSVNLNGVKSCSLVPADSVLTINNGRYYSVATDCIVKIDEE